MVRELSPAGLADRLDADEDFVLLDTRDPESFEQWRIAGAVNYPYEPADSLDIETLEEAVGLDPDDDVVTICAKGISSYEVADALESAGYGPVTVVTDGMEAWSAVYEHARVPLEGPVEVVQVQRRAKGCLGYLVADPATGAAAAVDVTRHTEEFHAAARERGWDVTHVLDTHVHADHIAGGRHLAADVGATYHLGERATERGIAYEFDALGPNDVVEVGDVPIKAVPTPGHTAEMVSYVVGTDAVLTGDTLFLDSVGRTELQFGEGDAAAGAEMLYDSLHRTLLALPDALAVLPGHFAVRADGTTDAPVGDPIVTAVGDVRTGLDLLQADRETFVETVAGDLPAKPANYESVIAINTGQRAVETDQEAIELELGPNNCAATAD